MSRWTYAAAAILAPTLAACGSDTTEPGPGAPPPTVVRVDIGPANQQLAVGDTIRLTASPRAADGTLLGGVAVVWAAEDPAVATIQPDGHAAVVEALAPGQARIRATAGGVIGTAVVSVVAAPNPVRSITLSPADTTVDRDRQFPITAVLRAGDQSVIVGRVVAWTSTNPAIATVSAAGIVQSLASGTTTIRAEVDGVVAEARVQVRPAAAPVGFVMVRPARRGIYVGLDHHYGPDLAVLGLDGRPVPGTPVVTWTVDDPTVASIDQAGTVRGLRPGETRVRATSGGVSGHATLVVFAMPEETATYDLTWDWWDDQWHQAPQVGVTTWVDGGGVEREIPLYLTGGSLAFERKDGEHGYRRTLVLEGWATVGNQVVKVAEQRLVDEGMVGIIVGGETGFQLFSRTTPGHVYQVVATYNAGHLMLRDAIGTAPLAGYLFRQRP